MKSLLSKEFFSYLSVFSVLFAVGLMLGIPILLMASLIPALFLIIGLLITKPEISEFKTKPINPTVTIGESVKFSYYITIKKGLGVLALSQELPPEMELVEGKNLSLIWKGPRTREITFTFTVRCPKRGIYKFTPVQWQARHFLGLTLTTHGEIEESGIELLVKLKTPKVRRIRTVKGMAISPVVVMDAARIGAVTTDFKNIREYVSGDPIKTINWKATARRGYDITLPPLVNEYEREGMKAVWVFLDADANMEFGNTIESCFEYAVAAAQNVTYYFIQQGYRVGMYIYNSENRIIYPDSGTRQLFRVNRELFKLHITDTGETLRQAVEKCHGFIVRYSPLCIVITRLDGERPHNIYEGVLRLVSMRRRYGKQMPIIVLGVQGYNLGQNISEYDDNTRKLNNLTKKLTVSQLRSTGCTVIDWDPSITDVYAALIGRKK